MEEFKTIKQNASSEIVEKKSRFITQVCQVNSSKEAEEQIAKIRKTYLDARHHCYAYRIRQNNGIVEKCSDDGEPSGTAGKPMLNLLQKGELSNVVLVVTRYFGGTLLGTGGLIRAYSESSKLALEEADTVTLVPGVEMEIELGYQDLDIFQYYCKKQKIKIIQIEYLETIKIKVELTSRQKQVLFGNLSEHKFKILKNEVIGQKYIDADGS